MEGKILGLDISSTCAGWSVAERINGASVKVKPLVIGALKFKSKDAETRLFSNVNEFGCLMDYIIGTYDDIDTVVIEEAIPNTTININTTATLLRFNGMCSLEVYKKTGIIPRYISSYNARRYGFPSLSEVRFIDKKGEKYPAKKILADIKKGNAPVFGGYPSDIDKKVVVWESLNAKYPYIQWLKNTRDGFEKTNYDASDSLALIEGYVNMIENGYADTTPSCSLLHAYPDRIEYSIGFCGEHFDKIISLG